MLYLKLCIGFLIFHTGAGFSSEQIAVYGEDVSLTCGECHYDTANPIKMQIIRPHSDSSEILADITKSNSHVFQLYKEKIKVVSFSPVITILVKNVSREDAGLYICRQGSSNECVSILIFADTPEKPVINNSSPAVLGDNLTLTCITRSKSAPNNHMLTMNYQWKMNGNIVRDSRYVTNGERLSFHVTLRDDRRQFSCSAEEHKLVSEESELITVHVEYKPKNIMFVPDKGMRTVAVGNVLDTLCIPDCKPRCTIQWLNMNTNKVVANDAFFKIKNVARKHQGNYTCIVENPHGRTSRTLDVDIYYLPIVQLDLYQNGVKQSFNILKLKENDTVLMNCSIDSHPRPVVTWYAGEKTVPFHTDLMSEKTPVVSQENGIVRHQFHSVYQQLVACSDYGQYYCKVDNGIEMAVNSIMWKWIVLCFPRASSKFAHTFAKENGKSLTVYMEIISYPKPTEYMLYRIHQGQHQVADSVIVQPVNLEPAHLMAYKFLFMIDLKVQLEMYTFKVENSEGSAYIDFNITLQGPPLDPSNVTVESGSDSITLYWIPGYNGGFQQTFVLAYKRYEETNWKTKQIQHQLVDEEGNLTATVDGFEPSTDYYIRLYAENIRGQSGTTEVIKVTTLMATQKVAEASDSLIAGICAAIIIIFIIVVVIILLFVRKRKHQKELDVEMNQKAFLEESLKSADTSLNEDKNKLTEEIPYEKVEEKPKKLDNAEDEVPLIHETKYSDSEKQASVQNGLE